MSAGKTDRELLVLAAKGAGLRLFVWGAKGAENFCIKLADGSPGPRWNPLANDGDEARLEAALQLDVIWSQDGSAVSVMTDETVTDYRCGNAKFADHGGDRQAARRRAGVLCAATIGEAMP